MVDKYNITGLVNNNGFMGLTAAVNTASGGFLGVIILGLILITSFYFIQIRNNDMAKSFIQALFITNIIGLLFYYAFQTIGHDFIDPLILLSTIILDAGGLAWLAFSRQTLRENR
jgi:hypothetical protein